MIEVKLNLRNMSEKLTWESWAAWIFEELTKAGIPALPEGSVGGGVLQRFHDADDFGGITYRWYPEEEWRELAYAYPAVR